MLDMETMETKCPKCDKIFSRKYSVAVHMRTHTGEKPYQCEVCKKQFTQKSNLTTHMRSHPAKNGEVIDLD